MGSISPVPFANVGFMKKVEEGIIKPTIQGLIDEDISYKGFIFFGLINVGGEPFVIEYNARLGDPETESLLPRLKTDILEIFQAVGNGNLANQSIEIDERFSVAVMMVARGYPDSYKKGHEIFGLGTELECIVFHAGTKFQDKKMLSNGGRVLAVHAYGNSLEDALKTVYKSIEKIHFDGAYYRKDLGKDLLNS